MSTQQNDVWMEAAWDNFNTAIDKGDIEFAKSVIMDTKEQGFDEAAEAMDSALRTHQSGQSEFVTTFMLRFLKKKKEEYAQKGLIPTLDVLIEDLENNEK